MGPIDAIVLAGGLGTRLRAAVADVPKPLAPVGGRPFLDLVLAGLVRTGRVGRVVLAVGYLAEKVRAAYAVRPDLGCEILFSEESEPLGTGGALRAALLLTASPVVLALNGDTFAEVDLGGMAMFHAAQGAAATVAVRRVNDPGRYGSVACGADGRVVAFEEKGGAQGAGGWINAGLYLFERAALAAVPGGRFVSLEREVLPGLVGRGLFAYRTEGRFIDIGLPETYALAQTYLEE